MAARLSPELEPFMPSAVGGRKEIVNSLIGASPKAGAFLPVSFVVSKIGIDFQSKKEEWRGGDLPGELAAFIEVPRSGHHHGR
jgi:hypothetical protein